MQRHLIACLLASSFLLSACVTTGGTYQSEPQRRSAAVAAKYPQQEINLLYIEAPKSFIATKLMIASLKSGVNSSDVDAIIAALLNKNGGLLAVTGDDDSLASATLERALIAGGAKLSGKRVVYVGESEHQSTLTNAAVLAGMKVEFIANPY